MKALRSSHLLALLCAWVALTGLPAATYGSPKIRTAFFDTVFPQAKGTQLENLPSRSSHCGVCHYNFQGGGDPWNPFGLAIKQKGGLSGTAGISNAIWSVAISAIDYDQDGFSNIFEITNRTYSNTPTFPGYSSANLAQVQNVSLAEVQLYITPLQGTDTTPPNVTLLRPNGGEVLVANRITNITWSATDPSGIIAVHLYESLDNGASYRLIARDLPNSGSYEWVPPNRPVYGSARIRVAVVDALGNTTNDVSNAGFTVLSSLFTNAHGVATTLRDFDMPGTQPMEHGPELASPAGCAQCHGNYDSAVEPYFLWQGSMMSHASRDPLFEANLVIANQDAAESGDLCLRCHFPRGWLGGRSVPTDGSRMLAEDAAGVSCDLCHRMVDPVFQVGVSPSEDAAILSALTFPGTNYGNGMYVIDPTGKQRGPFADATAPHSSTVSAFHRSAAFCGTCHDVSNPVFTRDANGVYQPNTMDTPSANLSPHTAGAVERTYSEWLASAYNSPTGVYAPAFAGAKPDGRVSTCQDCHLRDVAGYGANTNLNAGVPFRNNLPMHDLTGGSVWVPGLLTNLYPEEVNAAAIRAGIERSIYLLENAATLGIGDAPGQIQVTVTNETGHKLPTGYPEGRRIWLNVRFLDPSGVLIGESGAYDTNTGVLTRDSAAKIYEIHPGIDTNINAALGFAPGSTLHFVLNNKVYEDNRIPPRGFSQSAFAAFGGEPVGHHYEEGQYWDTTVYTLPRGAVSAEVKLYYQSTSKEFIEFLRDENRTNTKGQELYALWSNHGKCPPTLMASNTWQISYQVQALQFTSQGKFRLEFLCRAGLSYTIEFKDSLASGTWQNFAANGTKVPTSTSSFFEDDFTANSSGAPSLTGERYYRVRYTP